MRPGMGPKGAREGTFPEANSDSEDDIPEEGLRQPEASAISDEDALHAALADTATSGGSEWRVSSHNGGTHRDCLQIS
jgi:hypothetical protein